jgi:transposase-like protein
MLIFKWRHFKKEIILMLVRWYLVHPLSYREIEELAFERSLKVDHSTRHRQVNFCEGKKDWLVNFRRKESGMQLIAKFL